MAFDSVLVDRVRQCLSGIDFAEKKMFGGLAFMYRDYMTCGITGDRLMVRIPREQHEIYLEKTHVSKMDFTGKTLKGFVFVSEEGLESESDLQAWVEIAKQTVDTYPQKSGKKK